MTIYSFYQRCDGSIYGYTSNKSIRDSFKEQRDMDKFIHKKVKISSDEFNIFSSKYSMEELTHLPLYDGEKYINMVSTIREHDELFTMIDKISDNIISAKTFLDTINFKNKHRNLISELTDEIFEFVPREDGGDIYDKFINIDMFHLFYHMNKNTLK